MEKDAKRTATRVARATRSDMRPKIRWDTNELAKEYSEYMYQKDGMLKETVVQDIQTSLEGLVVAPLDKDTAEGVII